MITGINGFVEETVYLQGENGRTYTTMGRFNLPQDEYFEWEDILVYHQTEVNEKKMATNFSVEEVSSCGTRTPSPGYRTDESGEKYHWDGFSSISSANSKVERTETIIDFPSYNDMIKSPTNPSFSEDASPSTIRISNDDLDIYLQPSRHVDYFSQPWTVEDVSLSWRHLTTKERSVKNFERLENASWRAWTKTLYDLEIVAPQSINWLKDIDDTCLYGPFQAGATTDQDTTTRKPNSIQSPPCSKKACLKKPKVSELLARGSQLSWTGARILTQSCDPEMKGSAVKRVVQFNEIVEQCITIETSTSPARVKSFASRNTVTRLSSTTLKQAQEQNHDSKQANFWSPPTFTAAPITEPLVKNDKLSEWTWLGGDEEEEEIDWISSPPIFTPSIQATPSVPTSDDIVRDLTAKFVPPPTPARQTFKQPSLPVDQGYLPSGDLESDDEIMAQYLFDCDFSDGLSTSTSEMSSSASEDGALDDEVDFFGGGDVADERRMMERMQEIPQMEHMKTTLYEELMQEFNEGWA